MEDICNDISLSGQYLYLMYFICTHFCVLILLPILRLFIGKETYEDWLMKLLTQRTTLAVRNWQTCVPCGRKQVEHGLLNLGELLLFWGSPTCWHE